MVAGLSKIIHGSFSPEARELLVLREGLVLAKQLDLSVKWVECDAVNIITWVNSSSLGFSNFDPIFQDVRALYRVVSVVSCHTISRLWITLADTLAALAYSSMEDRFWIDVNPRCVFSFR
ncbi:hypothetical protein ACOSQ2_011317 [Xanthoceras sorbifolium]